MSTDKVGTWIQITTMIASAASTFVGYFRRERSLDHLPRQRRKHIKCRQCGRTWQTWGEYEAMETKRCPRGRA